MMKAFREACLALSLVVLPMVTLAACESFGAIASPSSIGCTAAETNNCRIIVAASIVKAAQAATSEQLGRGLITPQEARRVSNLTGAAVDLLKQARDSASVLDGTVDQKLAALDALLAALLREQVMKSIGS